MSRRGESRKINQGQIKGLTFGVVGNCPQGKTFFIHKTNLKVSMKLKKYFFFKKFIFKYLFSSRSKLKLIYSFLLTILNSNKL